MNAMASNAMHRKLMVSSLLPERTERLLDIGCGPITPSYFYAKKAARVTCVDWKLNLVDPIPANVDVAEGNFATMDIPVNYYDAIIAADVFEHIMIEDEPLFVKKCAAVLKPGGIMILSVPHLGTFTWLDPYIIRPAVHRLLWRFGLYKSLHNGSCDIRKGHKHYLCEELTEQFSPLRLEREIYWGYLFDPLLSWAGALSRKGFAFPGIEWLERHCNKEFERSWGPRAFNVALRFRKPEASVPE